MRRKNPLPLVKKTADLDTLKFKRKRFRLYELEQYTENMPEGEIQVILKDYIDGSIFFLIEFTKRIMSQV